MLHRARWHRRRLTVRFLVACASTGTAELLGFAAAGVSHQERPVVGQQDALDLILALLIDVCTKAKRRGTQHLFNTLKTPTIGA